MLILCFNAHADKWRKPSTQAVVSENGNIVARIEPSDGKGSKGAMAAIYVFDGANYKLKNEYELDNKISPVKLALSNTGTLIAFDNWYGKGYGNVVSIYNETGAQIRTYKLNQLYPEAIIKSFSETTSSIHWLCSPLNAYQTPRGIQVVDSMGGYLLFNENDGTFKHNSGQGCRGEL